jgi:hypothetical protein
LRRLRERFADLAGRRFSQLAGRRFAHPAGRRLQRDLEPESVDPFDLASRHADRAVGESHRAQGADRNQLPDPGRSQPQDPAGGAQREKARRPRVDEPAHHFARLRQRELEAIDLRSKLIDDAANRDRSSRALDGEGHARRA